MKIIEVKTINHNIILTPEESNAFNIVIDILNTLTNNENIKVGIFNKEDIEDLQCTLETFYHSDDIVY